MFAIGFTISLVLATADGSPPCDVLGWKMIGPGEDSIIYSLNYQEMGRGDTGLRTCLAAIEKSLAQHLVVLHGAFGATPTTANQELLDRFHMLRKTRGATCIRTFANSHPAVVVLNQRAGRLAVSINGQPASVPIPDMGKVIAIKKAREDGDAVVAIVSAPVVSDDKIVEEEIRQVCMSLADAKTAFVRIDLPAGK